MSDLINRINRARVSAAEAVVMEHLAEQGLAPAPSPNAGRLQPVLKVKRLHPDAIIPKYQTVGAACFDLHALSGGTVESSAPHHTATFHTGLAFEVPEGYVMLVYSRSGHGFNSNVRLANCVGVIDSDYRGEVQVKLTNDGRWHELKVYAGDRIAQAMLVRVPQVQMVEVDELSNTERGTGGFGSTGA